MPAYQNFLLKMNIEIQTDFQLISFFGVFEKLNELLIGAAVWTGIIDTLYVAKTWPFLS
jgi:hypothetical protein